MPADNTTVRHNTKSGIEMKGKNFELKRANFKDASELAKLCKKSFDQEMILQKDGKSGGPPSYDDPVWHINSMKEGFYNNIMYEGKIIGSIIIALRGKKEDSSHWELVQIFVDPDFWNKGIGTSAIKQIEEWFPEMYKFTTATPSFSKTNIAFYKKLGFKIIDEVYYKEDDINLVLFEKTYTKQS